MQRASPLKKDQRDMLIKSFCNDVTATQAASFAGVDRNTANLWFSIIRQLIVESLKTPPRFKGVVEMDQAFFGRKRKKRKGKKTKFGLNYGLVRKEDDLAGIGYEPGRHFKESKPEDLIQVFGILERGQKDSKRVYLHIVKGVDRKSLVPVVHLMVEGGSSIYSDAHRSTEKIKTSGYNHGIINKKAHYVTWNGKVVKPLKHMHINNIESFWGYAKERLRKFRGIRRQAYPLHIKECEFRFNHKKNLESTIQKLVASSS